MQCEPISIDRGFGEELNRLITCCDHSWFWNTDQYNKFIKSVNQDKFLEDVSFIILDNSAVVKAICPLIIEKRSNGRRYFSCGSEPTLFPAVVNIKSQAEIGKIFKVFMQNLENISQQHDVSGLTLRIPALCDKHLNHNVRFSNILLKEGFFDSGLHTQMLSFNKSLDGLWSDLSKGHRACIRKAQRSNLSVKKIDHTIVDSGIIDEYQHVHQIDAGRKTRSNSTFDQMHQWIKNKQAILYAASLNEKKIAFCLFITFKNKAFYASSCQLSEYRLIYPVHLCIWEAVSDLNDLGYSYLELGLQYFRNKQIEGDTKLEGISRFKRGFGGYTIPIHSGEYVFGKQK